VDGHVEIGSRNQARNISSGFEIVAGFPELRDKPIIIGESDPEGCAACSAKTNPQNAYRNGPLYASYTAAMFHHTLELAALHKVRLAGAVTWAFEFEDQPWFEGFRTLATNGSPGRIMETVDPTETASDMISSSTTCWELSRRIGTVIPRSPNW
jgi:xylan 1,4-beta-xylosidase